MQFKGLDLNLITAFVALVEASSVTRAANRLCLSQPATSAALKRLRAYFHDEILLIDGRRMHPTSLANALLPQFRACLDQIESVMQSAAEFSPMTSQRTFRIAASDYITEVVVAPTVSRLAQLAPRLKVEILLPNEVIQEQVDRGAVDLLLTPDYFTATGHPAELLFEERHVIVGWSGNPIFADPIDEARFMAPGHIAVAFGTARTLSFGDRTLQTLGKDRRIELIAPTFTMVPRLLQHTLRLAVMHERLAQSLAGPYPITLAPLPFPFPVMREMIQYHRARQSDEGLTWLRQQLRSVAARSPEAG